MPENHHMAYDFAKKYFPNCVLGFRIEFVEIISRFGIKIDSDEICK